MNSVKIQDLQGLQLLVGALDPQGILISPFTVVVLCLGQRVCFTDLNLHSNLWRKINNLQHFQPKRPRGDLAILR